MWVKPDAAVPSSVEFLSAPGEAGSNNRINMRTHTVDWGSIHGSTPGAAGDMTFPDFDRGQWHHLVLTMGGQISTSTAYLDGQKVGETGGVTGGGNWFDMRSFTIGGHAASGGFKGTIDELAVYPTVLSAGRVCAHYRAAGGNC